MRTVERIILASNQGTGNSAAVKVTGGAYAFDVTATFGGGTVTLQRLGPDGSTYLTADSAGAVTSAVGVVLALPPGDYRINSATATAVYASLTRVPGE